MKRNSKVVILLTTSVATILSSVILANTYFTKATEVQDGKLVELEKFSSPASRLDTNVLPVVIDQEDKKVSSVTNTESIVTEEQIDYSSLLNTEEDVKRLEARSKKKKPSSKVKSEKVTTEYGEVVYKTVPTVSDSIEYQVADTGIKYAEDTKSNTSLADTLKGKTLEYLDGFVATAYDLSIESCGKPLDHPQYGKTRSGYSLAGKSREDAMTVAVDKDIIPLGTKLYIEFSGKYADYTGIYTARDTGAFSGKVIDVFMGDFQSETADPSLKVFGKQPIKVAIVEES